MRNMMVALAVFLIVVIGLGTLLFKFASKKPTPSKPAATQTVKQEKFADKADKVRLISDGAIVGLENHRAIRITVDQTNRTVEVLKGYDNQVIKAQSFANDSAAYTKFLTALETLGYTRENPKAPKDDHTVCPLGIRYIYEATYKSGDPLRSWSSSCGGVNRLQGNVAGIQQLFRNQIPNYDKLVLGINLTKP